MASLSWRARIDGVIRATNDIYTTILPSLDMLFSGETATEGKRRTGKEEEEDGEEREEGGNARREDGGTGYTSDA